MIRTIELSGYKVDHDSRCAITFGTAGSYGIEKIQIVRGDIWDGLTITATFVRADTSTVVVVPASGVIDVPSEATAEPTFSGKIVFKGIADDKRVFTVDVPYIVESHSDSDGNTPTPPTPSEIEQITMLAQSAEQKAQSVVDAAERGDFDGAPGPKGEQGPVGPQGPKGDPGGASSWDAITGKPFATIGENLKVVNGVLSVDTAPNVEQDNTKPITSAAVYTEVGNIAALLASI